MRRRWIAPWTYAIVGLGCSDPASPPPVEASTSTTESTLGSSTTTTEPSSTTAIADSTNSAGSVDSGPQGPGTCAATCQLPADCVVATEPASDWECNAGFCDAVVTAERCDLFTCGIEGVGVCAPVAGISTCTIPCTPGGTECSAPLDDCIGVDDLGTSICAPLPCGGVAEGEPCVTPTGDARGTCIAGECLCMVDEECTARDAVCRRG
ncbi:MAG: hypothetical protein AAGF11_11180 [Myxococcota bacterium]